MESFSGVRVLVAGGGTGGHLYPGVALAEEIVAQGGEVCFVGTARGLESRVIPQIGWPLRLIEVSGLKGTSFRARVSGFAKLPRAGWQSLKILREERPQLVVGVGGFASGPIVACAKLLGIPSVILEQNSVPGITNRILGQVADAVFLNYPNQKLKLENSSERTQQWFPMSRAHEVGNPVRREIRDALSEAPVVRGSGHRLLIVGGSLGARAINHAIIDILPALAQRFPSLEIVHQTGKAPGEQDAVRAAYEKSGMLARVRVEPFLEDMAHYYCWCDTVIARAGATTISELSLAGRPSLLIPFAKAADDHQSANAKSLVEQQAALMVREDELAECFLEKLTRVLDEQELRETLVKNLRSFSRKDAAKNILQVCTKFLSNSDRS